MERYRSRNGCFISAEQLERKRALVRFDRTAAETAYDAGQQAKANELHARANDMQDEIVFAETHPA